MKVLILIVLAAISLQAQSIVDVARQERARQAQVTSIRVFTTEDARQAVGAASEAGVTPAATENEGPPSEQTEADDEETPAAAGASPETATAQPASQPAIPPAPDPVQAWNEEVQMLRTRIRTLQDQETALQLEMNQVTNQIFAPVTTQAARTRAQSELADVQARLETARKELADTRLMLQQMEAQGPPVR